MKRPVARRAHQPPTYVSKPCCGQRSAAECPLRRDSPRPSGTRTSWWSRVGSPAPAEHPWSPCRRKLVPRRC